jgi:predicted transcriptional regulator
VWIAQSALSADPQPMTAAIILERAPYINESRIQVQMAESETRGVLSAVAPHTYALTLQGRKFARAVPAVVHKAFQAVDDSIPPETSRLVKLLNALVTASLKAAEPKYKAALQRSRFYDPGPQGHILERLRRALNDLTAFRDDVHLASWCAYDVSGTAWEAFSHIHGRFVWGDPVTTATELVQKLDFRGYDEATYQQALAPLVARGWLAEADGVYRLTDKGERVRQTAEDETDRLFYAPWPLDETELVELKGLMEKISRALHTPPLTTLWQQAADIRATINQLNASALHTAVAATNLPPTGLFFIMHGLAASPKPLTAKDIQQIVPYMAETTIENRLAALAEADFLTAETANQYQITAKGQSTAEHLTNLVKAELAQLTTLAPNKVKRTADLLNRLVEASMNAPEPTKKTALVHARFHAAVPEDAPLIHVFRAIAQLAAFRDDAHVAAWHSTGITAHQWEAFSHVHAANIWGDPITSVAEAAEKLAFRGYDETTYQTVLLDCVARGWLAVDDNGRFTTTKSGQTQWQEIEDKTNQLFYDPWQILTVPERFDLHQLLTELHTVISNP